MSGTPMLDLPTGAESRPRTDPESVWEDVLPGGLVKVSGSHVTITAAGEAALEAEG